jgi:fumarate hydratase class II
VTAVAPLVGYERAAALYKEAVARDVPVRTVLEETGVLPAEELDRVLDLLSLTRGGRAGGSG